MLKLKVALLVFAGLANAIMSLAVLMRGYRRLVNITYFVLGISMAGWTLGIAAFLFSNDRTVAFFWAKVYYFFPLIIAVAISFFAASFPNKNKINKLLKYAVCAGFVALSLPLLLKSNFVTQDLVYHSWGKEILLDPWHYLFYSLYLLSCYSLSLIAMLKKSYTEKGVYAAQARLFFIGFLLTAIFGVYFNLILPWLGNYRLIWLGPLFTNIFIAVIAYSIVRHRMFDVRLIVARSLAYTGVLTVISIVYALITYLFSYQLLLRQDNEIAVGALNVGLFIVAIIAFGPLKYNFDRVTNRFFYRDAYDTQVLLDEFNKALVSTIDLEELLKQTSTIIQNHLKADYCLIGVQKTKESKRYMEGTQEIKYIEEELQYLVTLSPSLPFVIIATDYLEEDYAKLRELLQKNNVAVVARLINTTSDGDPDIGYIVMGPKKSGNLYNKQDLAIIEILANELVIAVQNSLRFEEIEQFNITLQQKVEDATRQLRHTNEKLKALDATKDEFISMASHQLRTPLTSVKGYLSMVLEGDAGKVTPAQKKLLDQAFTSSQRMVFLIADLLNVSRLKTGKFVIELAPTNLADVVEGEYLQLRETAAARGLTLEFHKPQDFPILMLDETKIRQVIMNFMDNAIYYTPSGGRIAVELEETPHSIEFRVVDNGLGVPKKEQPHLFTKFYRADNARKARPDGTGLGLFMAKKVVVAQGGAIIFKSQEGKGSTFGFAFSKHKLKVATTHPDV
jgi:signal transduction histidine kinase